MAGKGDDDVVGFHQGITSHLPSRRVLDQLQNRQQVRNRENNIHRFKSHSENYPKLQQHPKSSLRSNSNNNNIRPTTRPPPTNWSLSGGGGGHGMQAIFLDSSHKSTGGTGVFLPRGVGKDNLPSKKPACSPVLLPSRVVQALNLNVHDLGLQISPRQDQKNIAKSRDRSSSNNNKVGKDNAASSPRSCVMITQKQSASPEIFLPKEWTY